MTTFSSPPHDITMEDVPGGVQVTQHGRSYLARQWRLTDELRALVTAALSHGLTCLWQDGHPGGDTSHHISFSFDHSASSWVFVVGKEAGPPAIKRVTFNKRLKEYFKHAGLGWVWNWETAGGKNILLDPRDLDSVLDTLPLAEIRAGRLPVLAERHGKRRTQSYYASESDLEVDLFERLVNRLGAAAVQRQRSFDANDAFEVASRPDILVVDAAVVHVVELKLHEAGEAEFSQVVRYLRNRALRASFDRNISGVLIATRFTPQVVDAARGRTDVSLLQYDQEATGDLRLTAVHGSNAIGLVVT